MFQGLRRQCVATCLLAGIVATGSFTQAQRRGRKYTPPPETGKVDITVVRESNGKPIPRAAVIFHPIENGKDKGAMELKTDEEGKTSLDVIPIGNTVRLQIIADGFQTFGNDYVVDTKAKEITIKMKRPVSQYSIYKGNATGDQSGQATEAAPGQAQPQ